MKEIWNWFEVGTWLEQVWGCDSKILLYLFQSSYIQDGVTFFKNEQDWPKQTPLRTLQLDGNKFQNFKPLTFCLSWETKIQTLSESSSNVQTKTTFWPVCESRPWCGQKDTAATQMEKLDRRGLWVHMDAFSGLSGRNGYICWNTFPFYKDAALLPFTAVCICCKCMQTLVELWYAMVRTDGGLNLSPFCLLK